MLTIEPIVRLTTQLSRLPGIGQKTAQRLAYHILDLPVSQAQELAAAIIDRIVHHGRLLEFTGQSHRVSEALMFGRTSAGPASEPKEKTKEQAGTLLG